MSRALQLLFKFSQVVLEPTKKGVDLLALLKFVWVTLPG